MRQAILTKWLGPTNFKGSRIKAFCDAGSLILSWDHSLNVEENHRRAAMLLVKKLGWVNEQKTSNGTALYYEHWVGGWSKHTGVFVYAYS